MQEVIYIDVDPPPPPPQQQQQQQQQSDSEEQQSDSEELEEDVDILNDDEDDEDARGTARVTAGINAILGEIQGREDKDVHLVFSLLVFASTAKEPIRSQLLLQLTNDARKLKQQYTASKAAGTLTTAVGIDQALSLLKLMFILEQHGFSCPVRDQLAVILTTGTVLAERKQFVPRLRIGHVESVRSYRQWLLLQYLATKVKFEAAGFTYEAAEQLWGARTKAPYPRGSIHSAATQDAWREHTHLCCDIILLMSDFGQLRLPAKAAAMEALYICDEVHLRRAMRLNDLLLVAKLCRCFRILDADCRSLFARGAQFILQYRQHNGLWATDSNDDLEVSCWCVAALQAAAPTGIGPFLPQLARISSHPAVAPRSDIELVTASSTRLTTLTSMLEAMYSGHLTRGQLEALPDAYSAGEKRLRILRSQRPK